MARKRTLSTLDTSIAYEAVGLDLAKEDVALAAFDSDHKEPYLIDRIPYGECQDFCVWGGYSRGSPTRLPFVFEMQYARPDAIAGAKVEGPARSAGGSSLAPAIARREAAGALAREV